MNSLYVWRTETRVPPAVLDDLGTVRLQAVPAALAAVTGLLVAAERRGRVELVERVRPDDARAEPVGHPQDPRALLGPHPCGEPVGAVVRLLDRLLRRPEGQHRQHRSEDLLTGDPVSLGDTGEERRGEP